MTTALLLTASNLFAVNGPTNVVTITGGYSGGGSYYGYVDGATNFSKFDFPAGLALEPSGGSMFIADCTNNAVRWISNLGNSSASEVYTFLDTSDGISLPVAVAVDSVDNVYILNRAKGTNGYILEFSTAYFFTFPDLGPELGSLNFIATNAIHLTNATAMVLDGSANLYVTCNSNTVVKITPAHVSSVVGVITNAGVDLRGVAVLDNGQLALTDGGTNNGIWLLNPTNGVNSPFSKFTGFHGTGDTLGPAFFASFNHPENIAKAGNGWLVVADRYNHKVKKIDASGNVYRLFGVISNDWTYPPTWPYPGLIDGPVSTLETAIPICVQAREPVAVVVAPDGSVYDSEVYYHVIRHATFTGLPNPLPWPPGPPTGLTVSALPLDNYGRVTLTWTGSSGATNYNVKRSTTSGNEVIIASTNGTSYTDMNVLDGTTYYYVISALNAGGEGPNSSEVSATPLFSPIPANLIVVTTNFNLISLAWAPSTGATSYNLKRSPSPGGPYTTIGTNITTTSFNDTSVVDGTTYYYVVTAVNPGGESPHSSEVSGRSPLPPVNNPVIGWVDPLTFAFSAGTPAGLGFNNDVPIVIIGDPGSQTFYTYSNTPVVANLPNPTSTDNSAPVGYQSGNNPTSFIVAQILPDLAIKAIGEQTNHPNSAVVSALFSFTVGNPQIFGDNAAQFTVTNITTGAQMWYTYTTDGSVPADPTNGAPSLGPVTSGATLSLNFGNGTNLQFKIRGFKANYHPSSTISKGFLLANFVPNIMSFGFASGPGSSKFVASPGQTFFVPVSLSLLPNPPPIYGLQFNVTLTNLGSSFVDTGTIDFGSLLGKPDTNNDGYYLPIPPYAFISDTQPNNDPNAIQYQGNWYQNLVFSDTNNEALLGVGWLEVLGRTNLYNTLNQTLLTFPIVDGTDPSATPNQMVVGAYSFFIPANASLGDVYRIQIGRPSASTFSGLLVNPYGTPVDIEAPANTSLLGPGSINALKNVTIGQIKYLVGSVYPANWYNAGDFGSRDLANIDVIRVFDFAAYPIASPPAASDLFDALDSCGNIGVLDGATGYLTNTLAYPYFTNYPNAIVDYTDTYDTNGVLSSHTPGFTTDFSSFIYMTTYYVTVPYVITNIYLATPPTAPTTNVVQTNYVINITPPGNSTLFNGNDTTINQIAFGDGTLDVCDVYVTFRRSLDTNNLVWFQRFWTNGMRVATVTNASAVIAGASSESSDGKKLPAFNSSSSPVSITNTPAVNFAAGDVQATAGTTVHIPVSASVFGPYPVRVAMLNISVVPLDGSPALTTPISLSPGALGAPSSPFTASSGNGNYAAAWLNSTITGISNNATIGTLNITIPANATTLSAYAIHFDHASGSPNGLGSLPKHTWTGLITLSSRNTSSYKDSIPDSWRLRWFGTTNNMLSVSNASPSGDGINNWKKYVAGVDPNTPNDFPGLKPNTPAPSGAAMSIYWPTVSGKHYAILSSASLFPGNWITNTTITGNGATMEFDDHSSSTVKFYRVLILP